MNEEEKKEIEELKDILNEKENDFINEIKNRNDNFISKDKIRNIIILNSYLTKDKDAVVKFKPLKELLEE